ncbi:MAG: chalcone isomerase family protein [Gallionellaceae bacterium]|nr:chalcone isomerase family protein [Gallionellaceae bacterium]
MKKILLLVCGLSLSWNVNALEVAGVKLDESAQVGNATLQLNGAGIRTRLFFNIYVGALYLPQKQASAEAIITDEHEHRVALHIMRELSSEKLFNAFYDAIKANHSAADLTAMGAEIRQMAQIFDEVKEVKPGDVIALDYLPGSGTQISVNGTVRGTIAGAVFKRVLLRIWLGDKPVQGDLKKAMLGG